MSTPDWPDWLSNFYLSAGWFGPYITCERCIAPEWRHDSEYMDAAMRAMEQHWKDEHA